MDVENGFKKAISFSLFKAYLFEVKLGCTCLPLKHKVKVIQKKKICLLPTFELSAQNTIEIFF